MGVQQHDRRLGVKAAVGGVMTKKGVRLFQFAARLLLFGLLAGAALLYLAFSPLSGIYERLVLQAHVYPAGRYDEIGTARVQPREIYFRSANGNKLHGWLFRAGANGPLILFSHGNAGNISYRIGEVMALVDAGASVLIYDYSGYGKSRGQPGFEGIVQDALGAYQYVTDRLSVPAERIVLFGESLGSGVTCRLSRLKPCAGIILYAPFTSLRDIGQEALPFTRLYPRWLFPYPDFNNAAVLREPHPPLLILYSGHDTTVPAAYSQRLFSEASEPKQLVAIVNAGHSDYGLAASDEFSGAVRGFLRQLGLGADGQGAG